MKARVAFPFILETSYTYTYDALGREISRKLNGTTQQTAVYDSESHVHSICDYAGGTRWQYDYDLENRLIRVFVYDDSISRFNECLLYSEETAGSTVYIPLQALPEVPVIPHPGLPGRPSEVYNMTIPMMCSETSQRSS